MDALDLMRVGPVIPVIVIDDVAHAVPLARALVAGGVRVLEVTLRTRVALDAVRAISREVEDAIVGVGTISRPEHFQQAIDAGASFGVSPGLTAELIDAARSSKLPLLPGVMTPSDVIAARAAGFFALKLFPAQQAGGIDMLKALRGAGINVVAIHNHIETESPRVVFLHYWGVGPTTDLAEGLKVALDTQKK